MRGTLRAWWPTLAGLLGVILYHRWTIFSGFDSVQADIGDSRYIASVLEHWNAWAHGLAPLASPLVFFPVRGTLGYSDSLAVMGLAHIALRSLGLGVFEAMNVQLVLLSAASFSSCYLLLRRGFGLARFGGVAGASLFAFSWPRFAQLVHVQLQFTPTLPLIALLALECLRDGKRLGRAGFAWRACLLALLFFATLATTVYLALFAALLVGFVVAGSLLIQSVRIHYVCLVRRQWQGLIAALFFGALLAWPVLRLYGPVLHQSGGRSWAEVTGFLLDPVDLVWMGRENYAWGWLFARDPTLSMAKWAEGRLGFGLVVSLAWLGAIGWAARTVFRREASSNARVASGAVLAGLLMQLIVLRVGSFSAWWLFYRSVPGMAGLRGVGRIVLVAALPMAVGIGALVTMGLRRIPSGLLALVVALGAFEQVGDVQRYSAREADALAARVAAALPRSCAAVLVTAPKGAIAAPPEIASEAAFDAGAYLRANPDVAANWHGTAWQHYVALGRKERRSLDAETTSRRMVGGLFYAYTVPLAAELAGVPVVNGLSGWRPPGWNLDDPSDPEAAHKLADWLGRFGIDPKRVCVVPVALSDRDIAYHALGDPWWTNWSP